MLKRLTESFWAPFAAYMALALLGLLFLLSALMGYSANSASKADVLVHALSLVPAAVLFVMLALRERECPEKVFLLVGAPMLSAFALLLLPSQIPDELWHIFKVFSFGSPGDTMAAPAVLSSNMMPADYADLRERLQDSYTWSDIATRDDGNTAIYLPHLYFVSGLVVKLCAVLNVNPYIAVFFARFANAALFSIAGYWIIRLIPMAKVLMCVYLLNPLLLQQEASCSADAVTNIIALLFVAMLIRTRFKNKLESKDVAILAVLFLLTALSKYAYALLAFLFLLLVPKIGDKRKRTSIYIGTAACTMAVAFFVVFFMQSSSYQDTLDLIRNPVELAWVMKNTFIEMTPLWLEQFFGSALGALNVFPWRPCIMLYALTFSFAVVFNLGETVSLTRVEKIGITVFVACVTAAIILVFRNWTLTIDLRSDVIMGFQGRYMLPYLILLFLCFSTPRASLARKNCLLVYSGIMFIIYAFDIIAIISAFA